MSDQSWDVVGSVFEVLHKMHLALDKNLQVIDYHHEGLNKSHIKTLITLYGHKQGSMTEIGQRVGLVKGAFSPLVDRMLQLGYIQKTPSPDDRRKYILSLTPKGEAYADRIRVESTAAFEANFQRLSLEEQQALQQHLEGISCLLDTLNAR